MKSFSFLLILPNASSVSCRTGIPTIVRCHADVINAGHRRVISNISIGIYSLSANENTKEIDIQFFIGVKCWKCSKSVTTGVSLKQLGSGSIKTQHSFWSSLLVQLGRTSPLLLGFVELVEDFFNFLKINWRIEHFWKFRNFCPDGVSKKLGLKV